MDDHCRKPQENALSLVVNVMIDKWGSEVLLDCLDDPIYRKRYVLVFENCKDIHWQIYNEDSINEQEADIIGIFLGRGLFEEPAVITTDIFELTVLYESFEVLVHPSPAE